MTKQQKLELITALEEKARRQVQKRDKYIPNSGQLPVHQSNKKLRAVFSGNAMGKSCLLVNEAIWAASGYNPILKKKTRVPAKIIVLLDSPAKVEDIFLPELKKWIEIKPEQLSKDGKPYYSKIHFDNGSQIQFMFHLMEPLAFEGIEIDYLFADEPFPRQLYVALRRGARRKHAEPKFLLVGTPIAASWMRREIWEPWSKGQAPDTECFKSSSAVNKTNLAEGYLESFSAILSDKERRIRLEGEWFDLEGLALAHLFKRETHLVANVRWNSGWPVVVAIDPHPQKNHVAIMLGIDPNNRFVYLKEMTRKSIPRVFAEELKDFYRGFRVMDIVCDDFGSGEMTGGEGFMSFIQVLKEQGIRVRPTRWKEKRDEDWIQRLQDNLLIPELPDNLGNRLPRLRIAAVCKGIISDIENVQWVKMRNHDEYKPTLEISNKDFLACLKYALAASPRFPSTRDVIIRTENPTPWGSSRQKRRNNDDDESFEEF